MFDPTVNPSPLWCLGKWGSGPAIKKKEEKKRKKKVHKFEQSANMSFSETKAILKNSFMTGWRQRLDTGTEQDSINQQLDRAAKVIIVLDCELDTVNSSPTSTDWKVHTQMNARAARVLKPPATSCSPAPPSMLWDARHGPVRWMPTRSLGDRWRHCGRLRTLPYSPDWKSSMTGNRRRKSFRVRWR